MSTLLVLGSYSSQSLADQLTDAASVLCVDGPPPPAASRPLSALTYFNYPLAQKIEAYLTKVLSLWHRPLGKDHSLWRGVSLGEAATGFKLLHKLTPTMQSLCVADRCLSHLRPSEIMLGAGVGIEPAAWRLAARRHGAVLRELPLDPPQSIADQWSPDYQSGTIKVGRTQALSAKLRTALSCGRRKTHSRGLPGGSQSIPILTPFARNRLQKELLKLQIDPKALQNAGFLIMPWDRQGTDSRNNRAARSRSPIAAEIQARWPILAEQLRQSDLLTFEGYDLWPVLGRWLGKVFTQDLPSLAEAADQAQRAVDNLQPRLLLTKPYYAGGPPEVLARVCRQCGVPVVAVEREYRSRPDQGAWLQPVCADWVLTIGPVDDEWMHNHGIPPERTIPVGDTYHGNIGGSDVSAEAQRLQRALGLDDRPVILFADEHYTATQAFIHPQTCWENLRLIKETAAQMPQAWFVVKFHPSTAHLEGDDHVQRRVNYLLEQAPANLRLAPLYSQSVAWVKMARVVVTDHSATGMEAILLSKPAVYLRPPEKGQVVEPQYEAGFGFCLRHGSELKPLLERLLADGDEIMRANQTAKQEFLARVFHPKRPTHEVIREVAERIFGGTGKG